MIKKKQKDKMKIIIISLFLVCGCSTAYSQDLIKEIQKLTLANDSLQKALKSEKDNSKNIIITANENISSLNNSHQTEVLKLKDQIKKLENDTNNLHKEIVKLDRKKFDALEIQVQQKTDSIILLKDTINRKQSQINLDKQKSDSIAQKRYQEGQLSIYNQIGQTYQSKNLDALINSSTKLSVERDLPLVGNNAEAKQKLQDLQKYFAVQQILDEKYDEQKLKNAQTQLNTITQSDLVKKLNAKFISYKLSTDGLKETIDKIIEIDKKFVANNDDTQKLKLQEILTELSWYFRNYRFNFNDYPYLSNIVLEIMTQKQKDANTDVTGFLTKL